jgi:Glyoxalase/Bleomycin resistance protein/Dioxygenase superfamily
MFDIDKHRSWGLRLPGHRSIIIDVKEDLLSNTFHLSLDVPDLDEAVAFYRELLGIEPAKSKAGYAKFELADPPVALALQQASRGSVSGSGSRRPMRSSHRRQGSPRQASRRSTSAIRPVTRDRTRSG